MYGPTAGASVAVSPNMAVPTGWRFFGIMVTTTVNAVGMNTPPVNPCPTRKMIISPNVWETPHMAEQNRNRTTLPSRYQRRVKMPPSQAVSGMVMISPIR